MKPKTDGAHLHTFEVKIANFLKENETLKRGRNGKKVGEQWFEKKKPDLSIPLCPNTQCSRRHKGKCLLDRDQEAEQRSLDFTCKIKGGTGAALAADAKARASTRANAVSFEDLNENSDHFSTLSCSLWNPDEPVPDNIHISFRTCLDVRQEQGVCVDLGSPVDITFKKAHANLTTGRRV